MRRAEPEPEVVATLEAIDATLAGDPVDPAFAEIAELALLVKDERPVPPEDFVRTLDRRIEERFQAPANRRPRAPRARRWRRRRWWWALAPAPGLVAAVAVVAVLGSNGGSSSSSTSAQSLRSPTHATPAPGGSLAVRKTPGLSQTPLSAAPGLHVPNNGRQQVQASQLTLGARPKRIDTVAQEVFNVVGEQNGFVDASQVTAGGAGGYAHFRLSVPSISLPQTMSDLSALPYANVLNRTDTVEDVTGQYRNAVKHHDKAQIRALRRKIAYSQVTVNIQADAPPPPVRHPPHHSGFIGNAAHTALHVLTVIAGVALIALAVVVPVALVAALAWLVAAALKRRRRERALDMA
jgi:hypothetical protein